MAINSEALKERLRDTFGTDSQEMVGNKLSMTQGNVSKLLSGSQQPTLETIYHIAKTYDVSVDWLLGLSDKKHITNNTTGTTYASAVTTLLDLKHQGAELSYDELLRNVFFRSDDALLCALVKKALALYGADTDLFHSWKEEKLSLFEEKELLWAEMWKEKKLFPLINLSTSEKSWLKTYEDAVKEREKLSFLD